MDNIYAYILSMVRTARSSRSLTIYPVGLQVWKRGWSLMCSSSQDVQNVDCLQLHLTSSSQATSCGSLFRKRALDMLQTSAEF